MTTLGPARAPVTEPLVLLVAQAHRAAALPLALAALLQARRLVARLQAHPVAPLPVVLLQAQAAHLLTVMLFQTQQVMASLTVAREILTLMVMAGDGKMHTPVSYTDLQLIPVLAITITV
mgnify:FL=1